MALTYGQLKTLTSEICKKEGKQYISTEDAVNFDAFMNERLQAFSIETMCLYADNVVFTPANDASNSPVFDLRASTAFARSIAFLDQLYWNGGFLKNPMGQPGPWTLDELVMGYPGYLGASAGSVLADTILWAPLLLNSIRVYKKPIAQTGFASGWLLHKSVQADSDTLEIPNEFQRTVAYFAAADLLMPYGGGSTLALMKQLDESAGAQMAELLDRARMIQGRLAQRGRILSSVIQTPSAPGAPQQ